MRVVRIPAFAKVNLRLEVLGKRPDGYHELRTIFQTLSLHDSLTLEGVSRRGIELRVRGNAGLGSEPPEQNLVYRALDVFRRELKLRGGISAELEKHIPTGAGLGGGSSDAAAALLGYLRLTGRRVPLPRLVEIASGLGADVPFFLFGGRAVAVGRGDEIYPLPDAPRRAVLVVFPRGIRVPTADAYRWLGATLTKSPNPSRLWRFCALCWGPQGDGLSNDFEKPVFRRHPRLAAIQRALLQRGAAEAALAGSGSAVFGLFQYPAQARRAAQGFPNDQTIVCETLSRKRYRRAMGLRSL